MKEEAGRDAEAEAEGGATGADEQPGVCVATAVARSWKEERRRTDEGAAGGAAGGAAAAAAATLSSFCTIMSARLSCAAFTAR